MKPSYIFKRKDYSQTRSRLKPPSFKRFLLPLIIFRIGLAITDNLFAIFNLKQNLYVNFEEFPFMWGNFLQTMMMKNNKIIIKIKFLLSCKLSPWLSVCLVGWFVSWLASLCLQRFLTPACFACCLVSLSLPQSTAILIVVKGYEDDNSTEKIYIAAVRSFTLVFFVYCGRNSIFFIVHL